MNRSCQIAQRDTDSAVILDELFKGPANFPIPTVRPSKRSLTVKFGYDARRGSPSSIRDYSWLSPSLQIRGVLLYF